MVKSATFDDVLKDSYQTVATPCLREVRTMRNQVK